MNATLFRHAVRCVFEIALSAVVLAVETVLVGQERGGAE